MDEPEQQDEWQQKTVTFWVSATEEEIADLEDLAVYMDEQVCDDLHSELDVPCSPQRFWDAYADRVGEDEAGKVWRLVYSEPAERIQFEFGVQQQLVN